MTDIWVTPPHRPRLRAGDVHLWLSRPGDTGPGNLELLDPMEQARMSRFRHRQDRVAFARTRAFLRLTLSRYLGVEPVVIRFAEGRWGRPELAPDHLASGSLSFNLAHSRDIVLLAVSRQPVGVDVEALQELPDVDRLIRDTLTADEADLVLREGASHYSKAFLRFWVRKEAFLKGIGVGLSVDPGWAEVAFPECPVLRTIVPGLSPGAATGWRIIGVDPTPESVGALAVQGIAARLHRFEAAYAGEASGSS